MSERMSRSWMALAGLGGCLLIAVVQSSYEGGFSPRLGVQGGDSFYGPDPFTPLIPTAATVLALCLLRWWPYLLSAGGLLCVPIAWPAANPDPSGMTFYYVLGAAFPLLVIGALGAAQSLRDALVDLLGRPIADSNALCIPTAEYGHPVWASLGLALHYRPHAATHVRPWLEVAGRPRADSTAQHRRGAVGPLGPGG